MFHEKNECFTEIKSSPHNVKCTFDSCFSTFTLNTVKQSLKSEMYLTVRDRI